MTLRTGYIGSIQTARLLAPQLPAGYTLVVFDPTATPTAAVTEDSLLIVPTLQDLAENVPSKRIIRIDISDSNLLDDILDEIQFLLSVSDIIVHTAAAPVADTQRRAATLEGLQINFLDCIITGAPGADVVIGGNRFAYNFCEPLLHAFIPGGNCRYGGRSGAGHTVHAQEQPGSLL